MDCLRGEPVPPGGCGNVQFDDGAETHAPFRRGDIRLLLAAN
jgi:hypothetical protein